MPSDLSRPRRTEQTSLILNPEQLAEYARVDSRLPELVIKARNAELRRQFFYAVLSLLAGLLALLSLVGGFIYLVVHGNPKAAAALLTTGVFGLVGGFIRSRL